MGSAEGLGLINLEKEGNIMSCFGKAFKTRSEAKKHLKKIEAKGFTRDASIRKMSKKLHPRRKKLYHVGTYMDFLNFA